LFYHLMLILLLVALPVPALAAWHRADSDNFVVYADDTPGDLETFSRQLERFHSAMELVTNTDMDKPSPSNRVTIYMVRSDSQVRKLYGDKSSSVGGFYRPMAGGSIAVVPRVNATSGEANLAMITLLHEYAHHFTHMTSSFPMPRWMGEGGAEFFSSASFEKNGGVTLGRPAQHRAGELYFAVDVTAEELLDPDAYKAKLEKSSSYNAFYGRSWLLYHYLTFGTARKGQLEKYVGEMVAGKSSRMAALAAFGPFEQLEKDLDAYLRSRRMTYLTIKPEGIRESPVAVRALTPGEAAIMPVLIEAKTGVNDEEAKKLVARGREIAARYPRDALVLATLAENEIDADDNDAGIAAADAAIAIDPRMVDAYVQKGRALFLKAKETKGGKETNAAFAAAMKPLIALNRIENDHPLPLISFYEAHVERGVTPPKLAVEGLERAAQLAPFDLGLRMTLAHRQTFEGRFKEARRNLVPVAYDPHGSTLAEAARKQLAEIEGKPEQKSD
jgi:hypothetical protein